MDNQTQQNSAPAEPTGSTGSLETKPHRVKINPKHVLGVLALIALAALAYNYKSAFIAATVDGKPISRLAVIKELEKQSGTEALDALINEVLISNKAKEMGVSVSADEISQRVHTIENQFTEQGSSLNDALEAEGLERSEFEHQVTLQVTAEKILSDKIQVSDEEVTEYIDGNQITFEPGEEEGQKNQIKDILKQQKFNEEIALWFSEARAAADIVKFVNY